MGLEPHLGDPAVRGMVENLIALLNRPTDPESSVPYRKYAEIQREADRLRVEVDLLKMALEDARSSAAEEEHN